MSREQNVTVEFSKPLSGWIYFTIATPKERARISCSHVYCPFLDLVRFMTDLSKGFSAGLDIDEEGKSTFIRVEQEPGAFRGRLRVYAPGPFGEVEERHIDAFISVRQLLAELSQKLKELGAKTDMAQWYEDSAANLVDGLDLRMIDATVADLRPAA